MSGTIEDLQELLEDLTALSDKCSAKGFSFAGIILYDDNYVSRGVMEDGEKEKIIEAMNNSL